MSAVVLQSFEGSLRKAIPCSRIRAARARRHVGEMDCRHHRPAVWPCPPDGLAPRDGARRQQAKHIVAAERRPERGSIGGSGTDAARDRGGRGKPVMRAEGQRKVPVRGAAVWELPDGARRQGRDGAGPRPLPELAQSSGSGLYAGGKRHGFEPVSS